MSEDPFSVPQFENTLYALNNASTEFIVSAPAALAEAMGEGNSFDGFTIYLTAIDEDTEVNVFYA